jgi:hypothetical protein
LPTRRQFLQVGLAGAALLAAARLLERPAPMPPLRVLDPSRAAIVGALAPVVLEGSLPSGEPGRGQALREVVAGFDAALALLPSAARDEVGQLLSLLAFGPARVLLAGVHVPLEEAAPRDIAAFLTRWRTSRFDLARAGYQALTQLLQAAWYDNPSSWPAIGYPGPLALGARASP